MGWQVIHDIGNVFRVAVPMLLYFSIMWFGTFLGCRRVGMRYANAVVHVRASASVPITLLYFPFADMTLQQGDNSHQLCFLLSNTLSLRMQPAT